MKKKTALAVLLILITLVSVSCSKDENLCYYAYFGKTCAALVYSETNNTLSEIEIPLEQIVQWGKLNSIETVNEAMESYVGLETTGFIVGNEEVLQAIDEILIALSSQEGDLSKEQILQVLVERSYLLSDSSLISNMNRLCNTDFTPLAKVLQKKSPKVSYYNAGDFIKTSDIDYSHKYFLQWFEQIIN